MTAPGRIAKFTADGIHGPEVQFLGRSLPVLTTAIPFATALAGGVAGVRTSKPIRGGLGWWISWTGCRTSGRKLIRERETPP